MQSKVLEHIHNIRSSLNKRHKKAKEQLNELNAKSKELSPEEYNAEVLKIKLI